MQMLVTLLLFAAPAADGIVVSGHVVGLDDRPLSGVTVSSYAMKVRPSGIDARVTAKTDGQGRFRLNGLHPRAAFVFFEAAGFRFHGTTIPPDGDEVRVALSRSDAKAVGPPLRVLTRSVKEKHRLLKDLIDRVLPTLHDEKNTRYISEAAKRLAPYDPEFARTESTKLDARYRSEVLATVGDIKEALRVASQIKDPYLHWYALRTVADATREQDARRAALDETLLAARQIMKPDQRTWALSFAAQRLYDLNARDAAKQVLAEARAVAWQLHMPVTSEYARGCFAEVLALYDPDAAYEVVNAFRQPFQHARFLGNIARRLAANEPGQAERFLNSIRKESNRVTPLALSVSYGMAPVDLVRARRIVDGLQGDRLVAQNRAQGYGLMAVAIAKEHPGTAKELLRDAFEQLRNITGGTSFAQGPGPMGTGFVLLGYAQQIDRRANEDFWRVVALHPGPAVDSRRTKKRLQHEQETTARLVVLLGMFDKLPEVRRRLMEPIFKHWENTDWARVARFTRLHQLGNTTLLSGMAMTDPHRTIVCVARFQRSLTKDERRYIPQAWTALADILTRDEHHLGRHITRPVFHRWAPN